MHQRHVRGVSPDQPSGTTTHVDATAQPIARNLHRWRTARGITRTALAERAGVAKSTVSLIERGHGNPSIGTVCALAGALGVPVASLFQDDPAADELTVVRAGDSQPLALEETGADNGLTIRHLLTRPGGDLLEIYTLELTAGAVRNAGAHTRGLFEHLTITAGTVEVASKSFRVLVGEGDLVSFRADRPHSYRAVDGPARLVSVHEYPKGNGG